MENSFDAMKYTRKFKKTSLELESSLNYLLITFKVSLLIVKQFYRSLPDTQNFTGFSILSVIIFNFQISVQ